MMMLSLALVFSSSAFAVSKAKTSTAAEMTKSTKAAPASMASMEKKINLNTADAAALTKIPGIGPKKAEAIIDYRKANGKFKSIDDLQKVKGIGPKLLGKIKSNLTI